MKRKYNWLIVVQIRTIAGWVDEIAYPNDRKNFQEAKKLLSAGTRIIYRKEKA